MKKTTTWTLCFRQALARNNGRISNIAAPVVPIQLAKDVPIAMIIVLTAGDPRSEPFKQIPPAAVNKADSKTINGT